MSTSSLEERVVLSVPPGFLFVTPQQAGQFRGAFNRVFRATEFNVRTQIQAEARQLFANGTPTAQQLTDFQANAAGSIVAGTAAAANLFALLPGGQRNLVPSTARALLASSQNSLMSRVASLANNSNATSSLANMETALTRVVRSGFGNVGTQANQFLANTNLNRAVLMATDGSQSLSQFVGDRIISQLGSNLGNLAFAFPTVGNSVLFANGTTTANAAALQQFSQMTTSALGLTTMTLGNELQLLPNGASVIPAIQNAIFGPVNGPTGTIITNPTTGPASTAPIALFDALQALPTTSANFATTLPTVFSTAFSNLTNILSPFVGTFPSPNFNLPTTTTAGTLGRAFMSNTFENGFLNGFGSGTAGFGVAPTTLNTNFGSGFNSFVTTTNPALGFFTPPVTVSSGSGTGVVGTTGVTLGSGATSP